MAVNFAQITDYTFAEIRQAMKFCIVNIGVAGEELRMPDGRSIKRPSLKDAMAIHDWATTQESTEDDADGGILLGGFGEPF